MSDPIHAPRPPKMFGRWPEVRTEDASPRPKLPTKGAHRPPLIVAQALEIKRLYNMAINAIATDGRGLDNTLTELDQSCRMICLGEAVPFRDFGRAITTLRECTSDHDLEDERPLTLIKQTLDYLVADGS